MIRTIDLRGVHPTRSVFARSIPRPTVDVGRAMDTAEQLITAVRERGAQALREQAERFDGGAPKNVRVHESEITAAVSALSVPVRDALEEAIHRVRQASRAQIPEPTLTQFASGALIEQRWQPVERAGLYVPGGKAVYPSSVVMNAVPAQVAGVESIALASPPQRAHDHCVHPTILAAAGLLGIDEVYAMGGAGAIGALAWGVDEIGLEPVSMVTGPGNVYVAAAKRVVRGQTGIDAEAGTTEIMVIADSAANPEWVAADLLSQAEHDEAAASILVTDSAECAHAVSDHLDRQLRNTAHADRAAIALSGPQSAIVLVDDLEAAAAFCNVYGPEHLEIHTEDPQRVLDNVHNAGAIFIGPYSPVSVGDYLAGSNHVLPTGGQARFSSGLGAFSFLRPQQVVRYDADGLAEVADRVVALSHAEDLPAHGEAVTVRFV